MTHDSRIGIGGVSAVISWCYLTVDVLDGVEILKKGVI